MLERLGYDVGVRRWLVRTLGIAALVGAALFVYYNFFPIYYTHDVAVGAEDEVVAAYPCRLSDESEAGVVKVEQWAKDSFGVAKLVFTALAPGRARFACSDRQNYVVRIFAPIAVALRVPATVHLGDRFAATLVGVAADGRALELGRYASIDWRVDGGLRADNSSSCEFPPWCDSPPPASTWVRAVTAAAGRVSARFADLRATVQISISQTPDAAAH
jgi:hypothetical protein